MSEIISRTKASLHPTKGGGIYVGIVKAVTSDGKATVTIPKLGVTVGPIRVLNSSVEFPIKVNTQVLCAHTNASTTEMYILGYVNPGDASPSSPNDAGSIIAGRVFG